MTTNTNAAPDLRDQIMDVITGVWDRETQIGDAADTVIDLCELSTAAQPPAAATKEMMVAAVKFANGPAVYKNVAEAALIIEEQIYGEIYEAMLAAAPKEANEPVPLTEETLKRMHHEDQFGLFCDYDDFEQIVRATEQAHGIQPAHKEQPSD